MTKPHVEKVRHLKGFAFKDVNGCTTLQDIYFTIVSQKVNETTLVYKVAYCSPYDTFVKKEGIRVARESEKEYTVDIREGDGFREINFEILVDLVRNREDAPKAHRAYLESTFQNIAAG